MPSLTKQERKVYRYILEHRGCTTKDMQRDLGIECPSARLTYLRAKGVPIISIGKKKYPGTKAFEMYALEGAEPAYKTVWRLNEETGNMQEIRVAA